MLITDRYLAGGEDALVAAVDAAVDGGVNAVQLREKDLPPKELLAIARRLRAITSGRALLLVNSSIEVALAAGAEGVHLPEAAPMVQRPGRPFLVGRSVHSREAAERAWEERSDYLIAGPVFESPSHPGSPAAGMELIEAVAGVVALPVLAVGGVNAPHVDGVIGAGASGVAVISAILAAESSATAAQGLREALEAAWAVKAL